MERHIVHLDLDTFFVSVERLRNSRLNGLPVIIGGTADRGVVASCSYEARQFGIHSAMPSRLARQLCPQAVWIRGDMDVYSHYSRTVTDILTRQAPVVEKASIDEHYLDLTGMDKHFGCLQWTHELRQTIIAETGLPLSFALSLNKTVSKIGTGVAKPNNGLHIATGQERPFLAPLSIRKIPGLGGKAYSMLRHMGVERIAGLQQLQPELMEQVMGKAGVSIWRKANGIDEAPVVPYSERKSISKEDTFERDTTDMVALRKTIVTMIDALGFELRRSGKLASVVVVKIRYANFDTHDRQATIAYTNADHLLQKTALELFEKLHSRRMLIRLVGVKLTGLVSGSRQIDLFEDSATTTNLYQAMDSIRLRFGASMLIKAATL